MQYKVGKLTKDNNKLQHKVRKPCLIVLKQIPSNQVLLPPSRLCLTDVMLLNKAVEFFVNKSVGTKSNFYSHCEMIFSIIDF